MADYIKRKDVIDRLEKTFLLQAPTARAIVENIPAANVVERELYERALSDVIDLSMKRKTGKWIEITRYGLNSQRAICECSLCNNTTWVYDDIKRRFKYCPNCGARVVNDDV